MGLTTLHRSSQGYKAGEGGHLQLCLKSTTVVLSISRSNS